MKNWKVVLSVLLVLLLIVGGEVAVQLKPSQKQEKTQQSGQPFLSTKEEAITAYLAEMTLEEKIGQLFFARVPEEDALEDLANYGVGGYMLFARDYEGKTREDVQTDIAAYQAVSRFPLLIASDEEGGTVTRISQLLDQPFASPQSLYQLGGLEAILLDAREKVAILKDTGIYAGFFPVADLAFSPDSFIYDRTIGQDVETTATYVAQLVNLLHEEGFVSTLKHFPGYGDNEDSHTDIVYDDRSLEELRERDFIPFKAGIEAGADSIMMSHTIVSAIDERPTSLSPAAYKLVREELGFTGLIFTDDFDMEGLAGFASQETAALQAIIAGADMILSSSYRSQIPYLLEQIKAGHLSEARIDQSVVRILNLKYALGLFP